MGMMTAADRVDIRLTRDETKAEFEDYKIRVAPFRKAMERERKANGNPPMRDFGPLYIASYPGRMLNSYILNMLFCALGDALDQEEKLNGS